MTKTTLFSWILRIGIALIFLQTLFFKFTAHPDSIYIFTKLNAEPYGRIGAGIIELIASVLLLVNRTKFIGIAVSFGVIVGAILSHLLIIGTNVKEDGGVLFILAIIVLLACVILLFLHKSEYINQLKKIKK